MYDISLSNATQSSAAAPIYFDPKVIGPFIFIDGGVIANDPTLMAYLHATYNLKKDRIRIVSIGTGMANTTQIDPDEANDITWLKETGTLLTTTE
jgi:patatin-like phospholipase/acyl hydrolase